MAPCGTGGTYCGSRPLSSTDAFAQRQAAKNHVSRVAFGPSPWGLRHCLAAGNGLTHCARSPRRASSAPSPRPLVEQPVLDRVSAIRLPRPHRHSRAERDGLATGMLQPPRFGDIVGPARPTCKRSVSISTECCHGGSSRGLGPDATALSRLRGPAGPAESERAAQERDSTKLVSRCNLNTLVQPAALWSSVSPLAVMTFARFVAGRTTTFNCAFRAWEEERTGTVCGNTNQPGFPNCRPA
jgi:hypothetical protein